MCKGKFITLARNFYSSSSFELDYIFLTVAVLRIRNLAQYENLSPFERLCTIVLKEAVWSNRKIARHLDRSVAIIR